MGTGASVSLSDVLKNASASEIRAVLASLSSQHQKRIEKLLFDKDADPIDDMDEFGNDSGDESAKRPANEKETKTDSSEAQWCMKSQQPWQLGLEHCTLTVLENEVEGLIQFELIKNTTNKSMCVTISNAQFDELLKEQTGLTGAAQTNAAISQLFQEAHEEVEKPAGSTDLMDDFGEDHGAEFSALAAPQSTPRGDAEPKWQIKSQQPWQLGKEHCTLTMLENKGEGLVQFELFKSSSGTKMHVTCTDAQFDGLLKEQSGLKGAAQINAAIEQLFREAHEEISKPEKGTEAALDDFGEDHAHEFSGLIPKAEAKGTATAAWHVKSQQEWKHGKDNCTLTILENTGEGLIQFELLKLEAKDTMCVTCTDAQFDDLLKEQKGLTGTAQVNAAISQLFHEAHDEVEHDDFGDDDDNAQKETAVPVDTESKWHIQSQQPWQFAQEHCTLTILENKADSLLQFELLKMSTNTTVYVMCPNAQFDDLCKEQTGLSGTAQINAALAQLFREAHDEAEGNQ